MIIKRHPHEIMVAFNMQFIKKCIRIPQEVRPTYTQALIYYGKVFNSKISIQITTSSATFP